MSKRSSAVLFMLFFCVAVAASAGRAQEDPCAANIAGGLPISLNLKNAEVTDIFRLLAEMNNLNMVVSPNVHGTLSLRLSEVTLEEAMQVILDTADARMECAGSIIHIYARGESDRIQEIKQEMVTEIFSINYINTEDLVLLTKDFSSPDGKVRTFNTSRSAGGMSKPPMLIVTDYPQNVESIRKLVEKLDIETPQVFIEAKIVETDMTNDEILGTDWNLNVGFKGSPVKLDTPYSSDGSIDYGILNFSNFSAAWQRVQQNKNSNVLTDAKLTTLDNQVATIHVGETIPVGLNTISTGGGGGVTLGTTGVQQWDVGVSLKVTPHVLDKNVIMMHIEPQVSNVSSFTPLGGANSSSAPVTTNRRVDTNIMIRSGETIVIGGLVQNTENKRRSKVPFLGDLPLVGSLFRRKETTIEKTNLIIFITARIIELRGAPPAGGGPAAGAPSGAEPLNDFLEYK